MFSFRNFNFLEKQMTAEVQKLGTRRELSTCLINVYTEPFCVTAVTRSWGHVLESGPVTDSSMEPHPSPKATHIHE
jgi:hypothetical protein